MYGGCPWVVLCWNEYLTTCLSATCPSIHCHPFNKCPASCSLSPHVFTLSLLPSLCSLTAFSSPFYPAFSVYCLSLHCLAPLSHSFTVLLPPLLSLPPPLSLSPPLSLRIPLLPLPSPHPSYVLLPTRNWSCIVPLSMTERG